MSTFSRDPGVLQLDGIRAADGAALTAVLAELASRDGLVVADLTLGAWRGQQIARELFAQLGLAEPAAPPDPSGSAWAKRSGRARSRVGRLIDGETEGDASTLRALDGAIAIQQAAAARPPTTFCLLAGRSGIPWEPGDAWLVRFLAQALRGTGHRLVVAWCGSGAPALPGDWRVTWSEALPSSPSSPLPGGDDDPASLIAAVPGVLLPEVAALLSLTASSCIPLLNGCLLVPPARRRDDLPSEMHERLAAITRPVAWVAAYASAAGRDEAVDPALLWQQARHELQAGELGLTVRLVERAIPFARTLAERALFELLAQGARIGSKRFAEAAAVPDPDDRLPPELAGWMWHTLGWAQTMCGRAAAAERSLERARALLEGAGDTDEHLYVLNISALNRLRLGDWEGALEMEQRIRAGIERVPAGAWQLRYINGLNRARLHKRRGSFDACERAYRDAFATTEGMRSDSDAIYGQVCQARLSEACGRPADAFRCWLAAALHWAASAAPEAIGSRVTSAILDATPARAGNVCDDVADALALHLARTAAAAEMPREAQALAAAGAGDEPTFMTLETFAGSALGSGGAHALSGPAGYALGLADSVVPVISSPSHRRLRAALASLLSLARSARVGRELRTVVVDDQLGHDLPRTEAELIGVCLRLQAPALLAGGASIALDGELRARLERLLWVRLGSAVDAVHGEPEGTFVSFKRYREPEQVPDEARRLLGLLEEARAAGDRPRGAPASALPQLSPALLRSLERSRILELTLPDEVTLASLRLAP